MCGKTLGKGGTRGTFADLKGSIVAGGSSGAGEGTQVRLGGWEGLYHAVTCGQVKDCILSLVHREAIKGFTEG